MRKFIFTLTMLLVTINLIAQEHLSFKGIPIEGSITEFCKKLEDKGLTSTNIYFYNEVNNSYYKVEPKRFDRESVPTPDINGEKGTIAIIGPKRMEYARVMGLLDYVIDEIKKKDEK